MSVQRGLELGLLAGAVRSREAAKQAIKSLGTYEFKEQGFVWLWEEFKGSWKKGELARFETLEARAKTVAEDSQQPLLETLLEVFRAQPSTTPQTDANTLREYHRQDALIKGMDRSTKAIIRGDLNGAYGVLQRTLSTEAAPTSGIEVSSVIDFDDWSQHDRIPGIETGLKTYDEVTLGGMRHGDLGVIMGVTGMGKSILGVNFGFAGFRRRKRTLHIDSENGLMETRVRYVARATRLPSRALTRQGLNYSDDFRLWAETNRGRIHDHLRILHIGIEQATMSEVDAKIDEISQDGWAPDQIIFDSPDHVVYEGNKDNAGAVAKQIYTTCKSMAQRYNAVCWTITQAKQEAEGKIATNKHAAWGYDKSRLADSVLTINPGLDERGRPMGEREMGERRCLFVSKARKTSGRFIINLKTDFATAYVTEELDGDVPQSDDD